jgi:hypothetical protein
MEAKPFAEPVGIGVSPKCDYDAAMLLHTEQVFSSRGEPEQC